MKDEEIRTTTKAVSKPMISNRLPKAFSQANKLYKKHVSEHQDLAAAQEFKKLSKLLSPLKISSPQRNKRHKVSSNNDKLKHLSIKHQMLLEPFLNIQKPGMIEVPTLDACKLRVEEILTMSLLTNNVKSGCVRKVIHAPSLKIYAVKEIPVNTREARKGLLEWLTHWQRIQRKCCQLVQINSTFWNSPEGYVSIVMKYMNAHSLQNIIDTIGMLPENVLSYIAQQVLEAIAYIHDKGSVHKGITPSQILLTRQAKVKLSLGLSGRLLKTGEMNLPSFDVHKNMTFQDDVFDFGLSLFIAAVGGVEFLDTIDTRRCCVLHSLLARRDNPIFKRLSPSLADFLCKCLRFQHDERSSAAELLRHEWLDNRDHIGPSIQLEELVSLIYAWNNRTPSEYQLAAEKQLDRLSEALSMILLSKNKRPLVTYSSVKEIAEDLGLDIGAVVKKLGPILNTASNE